MRGRTAVVLVVFVIVGPLVFDTSAPRTTVAESQPPGPILIPGVQEPEEMRVEPFPVYVPTAPERMLAEAMKSAGDKSSPDTLLPALDRILATYPDYSDGYAMRLASLCKGNDRAAILSNINSALKYVSSSLVGKNSPASHLSGLLSMRAKIEHANGDDAAAMEDLDKAIHTDLARASDFPNSGAVAPEKSASACTWTEPDMDALVQRFPTDYRAYLFRGLYYAFFTPFTQDLQPLLMSATESFRKAAEMNPRSALPHFFIAGMSMRAFAFKKLGMSDAERDEFNHAQLNELNKALTLDPYLLPALKARAEAYFELKQFQRAVPDYDQILALDPKDAGAYNDRGLAKMQLGSPYEAIADLSKAVENKKRELQAASSYESRADAYMKTQQWDLAIRDLTTAISLQVGGAVPLMNINQFRALYPEYKRASDEAIVHKLNQTFLPNIKYADFSKSFLHDNVARGFLSSIVIADIYLKRSDAYLKAGIWHRAAVEFRRAVNGFPMHASSIDRWREANAEPSSTLYIDMKTFDDSRSDSVKLWVKKAQGSSDVGPVSLQQYELNCSARQIRTVSFANYDASGTLTGGREGGKWGSVVPETLGETILNGICQSN